MKNFIPVALDTYFRGSGDEVEFCKQLKAGGNHMAAGTAGGRPLGDGKHLHLRERELGKILEEFKALPEEERKPDVKVPADAAPPKRPLPAPPEGGLVIQGYCTYMRLGEGGKAVRSKEWYYKKNPDRWAAETQNDFLWMTAAEAKSLVPADPAKGAKLEVSAALRKRFFSTLGIDYMEGSVNSLPPRETAMALVVEEAGADTILMKIEGGAKLGKEDDEARRSEPRSRGCDVRVLGTAVYDRSKQAFTRFEVVGLGRAWGSKMDYTKRELQPEGHPWLYGIAWELVTTRRPMDVIPPYNMLHYGEGGKYFEGP